MQNVRRKKMLLVGCLFTLIGLTSFIASARGVNLQCDERQCEIHRRSLWSASSDSFLWDEISRIGLTVGERTISASSFNRGVVGVDITLTRLDGTVIPLFGRPVGYYHGPLDYTPLNNMLDQTGSRQKDLHAYSLGGHSYFIAPTIGLIGFFLVLFSVVRPIETGMQEAELSTARRWNLVWFGGLLVAFILVWVILLRILISWLVGGLM